MKRKHPGEEGFLSWGEKWGKFSKDIPSEGALINPFRSLQILRSVVKGKGERMQGEENNIIRTLI